MPITGINTAHFLFTVNGYQTLFDVLGFIQKKENIEKIPKNLPVYMIAGEEDPVGNYGKGVEKVFEEYRKCGIRDLELSYMRMTGTRSSMNWTERMFTWM